MTQEKWDQVVQSLSSAMPLNSKFRAPQFELMLKHLIGIEMSHILAGNEPQIGRFIEAQALERLKNVTTASPKKLRS